MELELEAVTELHRAAVPIVAPADQDEAERLYQMALKESAEMSAAEARAVLRKAREASVSSKGADCSKDADLCDGPGASGGGKRGSSGAAEDAELLQALDLNLMELEMQNRQFELEQQVGRTPALSQNVGRRRRNVGLSETVHPLSPFPSLKG
jgi:hypothetical protein